MPQPEVLHLDRVLTPIGMLLAVTDERDRLRALDFEEFKDRLKKRLARRVVRDLRPAKHASEARVALEAYFGGELEALDRIAVRPDGTEFQRQVWRALRKIPAGRVVTYGTLARKIGRPTAVRAVGAANGANPIGIVVPCHRVLGASGALTGYGGGLERKRWLLAHEGALATGSA